MGFLVGQVAFCTSDTSTYELQPSTGLENRFSYGEIKMINYPTFIFLKDVVSF